MKAIRAIFLTIFLTGLAHLIVSQPPTLVKFDEFLQRIDDTIAASSDGILPFMIKDNVIEKLKQTSLEFKYFCVHFDKEALRKEGQFSPISALTTSIALTFVGYKENAKDRNYVQILNELQSVDPIGLNVYLTTKNVDDKSPDLMHFVLEYRETTYEKVLITPDSEYHISDFLEFVERLKSINPSELSFRLQLRLLANLWQTSNEFKELCVENDVFDWESKSFSTASALDKAIKTTFEDYKMAPNSAEGSQSLSNILSEIQQIDPIGLNVYLTKKMEQASSPTFVQSVKKFQTTMNDRVRLIDSRTDSSYANIPDKIREELTTEFKALNHASMDYFIEIAMEQFENITMYPTSTYHSIKTFKMHKSIDWNDVQILYNGIPDSSVVGHAVCIQYHASSKKIRVYDSVMCKLNSIHHKIISRLYPYNQGIEYKESKTLQGKTEICGLFVIYYATMLLLGKDPAEQKFKLNTIHGEEGLYMRLHALNMFANRKLSLMDDLEPKRKRKSS